MPNRRTLLAAAPAAVAAVFAVKRALPKVVPTMSKLTDDLGPAVAAHETYDANQADRIAELEAQVADLEGQVADLTQALEDCQPEPEPEPEPEPTGVLIGQSIGKLDPVPASVTAWGVQRYFFQGGDFTRTQTWTGQAELVRGYRDYGCRTFSLSFKPDSSGAVAFGTPNNITNFLNSAPDDVELLCTYYHEHDGNIRDGSLTMARYTQGCTQLADLAHAAGAKFGPIHNGMVYDTTKTPKWGLYPSIWKANEAPVAKCDFWGVDCYSPKYEDPARMDALWDYAESLNLPLLIGELAAPKDDPARQLDWATKARAWALNRTKWAMWWHSQVSATDINWCMTDATARAWYGL